MTTIHYLTNYLPKSLTIHIPAAPDGLRWGQLYVYKDREVTMDLIKRFERAGYKALAITVDTPSLGRREADVKNR